MVKYQNENNLNDSNLDILDILAFKLNPSQVKAAMLLALNHPLPKKKCLTKQQIADLCATSINNIFTWQRTFYFQTAIKYFQRYYMNYSLEEYVHLRREALRSYKELIKGLSESESQKYWETVEEINDIIKAYE